MKKNTWLSKPITWGGYLKLVGVSMVVSAICTAYTWWQMGLFELFGWSKESEKDLPEKENEDYLDSVPCNQGRFSWDK